MQQARPQQRAPGSFSPLPSSSSSGQQQQQQQQPPQRPPRPPPPPRRVNSSSSSDDNHPPPPLTVSKSRGLGGTSSATPIYAQFASQGGNSQSPNTNANPSTSLLLQNFSRPTISVAAARASGASSSFGSATAGTPHTTDRTVSPLSPASASSGLRLGHSRKHSQTQGMFEPTLPSTSTSNLSQVGMTLPSGSSSSDHGNNSYHRPQAVSAAAIAASKIAAQAAVLQHQTGGGQQQQQQHNRQRSQTVPMPGMADSNEGRRGSGAKAPLSPPMLSLTEASGPRDSSPFGNQGYHNGLMGNHTIAATTAANVVFPLAGRSGQSSPGGFSSTSSQAGSMPPPPLPPPLPPTQTQAPPPDKPATKEKSSRKLFSRPGKIGITKGSSGLDAKDRPLPSPGKIGSALASLQRANFSTSSLVDSSAASSIYTLGNSSSATIRAVESTTTPVDERPGGILPGGASSAASAAATAAAAKEKKHHFLSRGKHKLGGGGKDDFHLPLSSASSNSRPSDPNAPSSLYSFNLPPSPGPGSTSFPKGMSGLHTGRRDRIKDKFERSESRLGLDTEPSFGGSSIAGGASTGAGSDWTGPGSLGHQGSFLDPVDPAKYGLGNLQPEDAWPFLKAKLQVVFEGEDLRLPVEDFNRVVTLHVRYCVERRAPQFAVEDLRELLAAGFASLDRTLRKTPEGRVIPAVVELWVFTFTSVLPYMQAVFLPLDLEFAGCGSLLSPEQARDFWGGVVAAPSAAAKENGGEGIADHLEHPQVSPAAAVLDVRRFVLVAFRDIVILPRYDMLKAIFSRLSLEFLPASLASLALASPLPPSSSSPDAIASLMGLSSSPVDFAPPPYPPRPGTSASHAADPSLVSSSYNSNATTLLGDGGSNPSRSRAISNVSFGSGVSGDTGGGGASLLRPFTPSSLHALGGGAASGLGGASASGSLRDQNVEDSKQVTEMVGRMLQCMSVLAGLGAADGGEDEANNRRMEELCKLLKLNWLGRGRTGRNRRGLVGGRVRRDEIREEIRAL